jgi:uncharacterized protein with NRDE domain
MCTVLIMNRVHRDHPVVLGANRDEFLARPAAGPQELAPGIFGGRDLVAGGTWMAATPRGTFAALTNYRAAVMADRTLRSRGEIVVATLAARDLAAMTAHVRSLDPRAYNPFNLLFGDAGGVRVAYARGDLPEIELAEVPLGVHALLTDRLESPTDPNVSAKLVAPFRELPGLASTPWPALVPELRRLLSDHTPPGLPAMCIHTPSYGTRSSSLLAVSPGRVDAYWHADSAPCQADYRDFTSLLAL